MNCNIFIFILSLCILYSCSPSGNTTYDFDDSASGNKKVVLAALKYHTGNPKYFIPTNVWPYGDPNRSNIGPIAWTSSGFVGKDNKINTSMDYWKRLSNATLKNQTSYEQYIKSDSGGYPGWAVGDSIFP